MRARFGIAASVAALVLLAAVFWQPRRLEDHEQYQEALRVLHGDNLEATDSNVRSALRLIDVATQSYDDGDLKVVDPRDWPPRCGDQNRACRERPVPAKIRHLSDGSNVSLLEIENTNAKVWVVEDLISEAERAVLLHKAVEINFTQSPTNHATGQDWRSSSSAIASRSEPVFQSLLRRTAALCDVPLTFIEAPQIVRYKPGERYKPHLDSEGPEHRHWTLLLYLNDPGIGGATAFPLLGFKVLPAPGVAVFWQNLRPETGRLVRNYYTLHDGQAPLGSKMKYAVNLWVRSSTYDPDT